jgi:hypothetical protein
MCDHTAAVERALTARLKRNPDVTAIAQAGSIYRGTVPASRLWPFVRFDTCIATPFRATGLDSSVISNNISGFAKPLYDEQGVMLATAESVASSLASAIGAALDGAIMSLGSGWKARTTWIRTRLVQDRSEASVWHGIVAVRTEVAG